MEKTVGNLRLMLLDRKLVGQPLLQGHTGIRQGTGHALRGGWRALQGPEIHDCLVVQGRTFLVQQLVGQLPEILLPLSGINRQIHAQPP